MARKQTAGPVVKAVTTAIDVYGVDYAWRRCLGKHQDFADVERDEQVMFFATSSSLRGFSKQQCLAWTGVSFEDRYI